MLESRELVKCFGAKAAVDHVSVTLWPGHVYALLGPNGSGKTTWMKTAASLIRPTSGAVLWKDVPVGVESRREIAYMATEPFFYPWMTVGGVGTYYADFFGDYRPAVFSDLLRRLELDPAAKIRSLSSGMTAKLKIAVTLARDAKVYLLDEPFNGIDLLARDAIRSCIVDAAQEDKILLLSSHLVEEMEAIADTAIFLSEGKLVEVRDLEAMRTEDGVSMSDRYRQIYGHTEG